MSTANYKQRLFTPNKVWAKTVMSTQNMDKILALYDAEIRANPASTPGLKVVRSNNVTRLEGVFNFICSWTFSDHSAALAVSEQANYFRQRRQALMWRVYDHDKPTNIEVCLKNEGFVPDSQGSLMVLPLAQTTSEVTEYDIRRVTSPAALSDYLSVAAAAFGTVDAGDFDYFLALLSDPNFALFTGYSDDKAVSSGRLEMPVSTSFGLLFGGGVAPSHRGKGFYRALVKARALIAQKRGLQYLITEARETSRPILAALGFITLVRERTWLLPVEA